MTIRDCGPNSPITRFFAHALRVGAKAGARYPHEMGSADDTHDGNEAEPNRLSDALSRARARAEDMLADLRAQDPAAIDLTDRLDSMPGMVIDEVLRLRDQLSDDARRTFDQWQRASAERMTQLAVDSISPQLVSMIEAVQQGLNGVAQQARWWQEQQSLVYGQASSWQQEQDSFYSQFAEWQESQNSLHRQMMEWQVSPLVKAMQEWAEVQAANSRSMWEAIERAEENFRTSLPPNWRSPDVEFPDLGELERLQLTEGLPLAWVPPNRVLSEILHAKTAAARRRVIAREADVILRTCERELRRLSSQETKEWRSSARQAGKAMRAGHWQAGQALAAIALDTATVRFVRSSYPDAVTQSRNGKGGEKISTPPGSGERSLPTWSDVDYPKALLVLHSLYGAFAEFNGGAGEPVPTQFTRHGTIHSMSRRQYSKANALIALMHVVSLLCLIEDG